MKILVINIGSTSLKYKLFEMNDESVVAAGGAERVRSQAGTFSYKAAGEPELNLELPLPDHNAAIDMMRDKLADCETGVLNSLGELAAIGFKTVLAGDLPGTLLLTDDVIAEMERYNVILPSHNPPYISAIRTFQHLLPEIPLVGVFETGFHRDRPEYATIYGLPYSWYDELGIRKYGYHGNSHRYVSQRVCEILGCGSQGLKIASCHLGGSSSVCAIKDGRSVDVSMGFSAQSGIINSTRNGDLDPFIILYLMQEKKLSLEEISRVLNEHSGMDGISGLSGDLRDLEMAAASGNGRARLALDVMAYDVKRYIGAYVAVLGGLDVLVFTGGIGEKGVQMRTRICAGLGVFGLQLDERLNSRALRGEAVIGSDNSRVKIVVIPANEELMVARETARLIRSVQ